MKRIVELKERNYADASTHADAPVNYEDAIENYKRILDITGDITANIIAPNSEAVDIEPYRQPYALCQQDLGEYPGYTSGWIVGCFYASPLWWTEPSKCCLLNDV